MDKREGGMRWAAVGRKRGGARRLLPPPFENVLGREASTTKKMDRLSRRKGREGGKKEEEEGKGESCSEEGAQKRGKGYALLEGKGRKKEESRRV